MLLIFEQFDSTAFCVQKFYFGTWHTIGITEFWPVPLEQQLKKTLFALSIDCVALQENIAGAGQAYTHFFFIRNSFLRNLYWDGQIAKKLSVLKPQRLVFVFILSVMILKTQ